MNDQATYFQKMVKCGKQRCKKCRATGEGHGPYWFVRRKEGDRTVEKYIGVHLPPTLQQVGRSPQSPLIGREQELKQLQTCFEEIEERQRHAAKSKQIPTLPEGSSHFFLLEGEAGMGKTRLAEEGARFVAGRRWTVVWSSAYAEERTFPYRPWIEVLRRLIAQDIWQQQEHTLPSQVYRHLRPLLPEVSDDPVPLQQEPFHVWEAVCELLKRMSKNGPLLIVLDDLHWADASSFELLAYLARHLQSSSIVIIGTCRDTELDARHPLRKLLTDLHHERSVEILPLQPLTTREIRALLAHQLPLSDRLTRYVEGYASGNPFFAEELAHTIKHSKTTDENGTHALLPLPRTVSALLDHRLQGVSSACFTLLEKAAVLGRSFELSSLLCLARDQSEDVVISIIEEALQMGLLTEEGIHQPILYHFWHPLLVSHLYEQLSAARRASFHRRAAEMFSLKYQNHEDQGADIIMHHLVRGGGEPLRIAYYAELAGNRAYALSSYPAAAHAYAIALDSLQQCAFPQDEQRRFTKLLELQAECTRYQGKYDEARRWYEEALQISSALPPSGFEQELQQEIQRRALLCCEIGFTWYSAGNLARAQERYQQSEQILTDANSIDGPAWSYLRYRQSYLYWREGNYTEALPRALESLHCFTSAPQEKRMETDGPSPVTLIGQTLARDPVGLGRIHLLLGLIANGSGHYHETTDHWKKALAIFEQYGNKRDIAVVSCNLGDVHLRKADHQSAQVALEQALTIAEQIGEPPLIGAVCGNLGILALRLGKLSAAEEWLRKGIICAQETKDRVYLGILHGHLTDALQEQGNYGDAAEHAYHCLSIGREINIQPCIGLALVTLGKLHYTQALAIDIQEEALLSDRREHTSIRFLMRAKRVLQRVLELDEIETETRTEARIILAHVMLLLNKNDEAQVMATQALEEASRSELTWLIARAQRVLGMMYPEQGSEYFEQALHLFNKAGMRLEYARTLRVYAEILSGQRESVQRARGYLEEADQIFTEGKANLDRQLVAQVRIAYQKSSIMEGTFVEQPSI